MFVIPNFRSYLQCPLREYFRWIRTKLFYERRYEKLQLGYMTRVQNVIFGKYNWTSRNVILDNVIMGDFSYVADFSVVLETTIGKFCSIGPNVRTAPGKHPTNTFVSTHPALFSNPDCCKRNFFDKDYHNPSRHVTIGNDVWICANVVVADGVTIGDGCIIMSNSVVSKDVEPYTIVGGVPAKFIRMRFNDKEIEFLKQLKWWDKDIDWIENNAKSFLNIKDFVKNSDN
jgi:acetyltransferase-like isoleucine patch superfamily enzyme